MPSNWPRLPGLALSLARSLALRRHRPRLLPVVRGSSGVQVSQPVQPADIGWPTGNRKKLSCCQAQLSQATCLAVAYLLSISCWSSYVRRLYRLTRDSA